MDSTENTNRLDKRLYRHTSFRKGKKARPIQLDFNTTTDQTIPSIVFGDDNGCYASQLSPCQKVQMLFSQPNVNCDVHPIFTEMLELKDIEPQSEWNETARWVKFEEDVEASGNRWSRPHVATLSLHSWFEFRSFISDGMVLLDMEAANLREVIDKILDLLTLSDEIDDENTDKLRQILFRKRNHQYEQSSRYAGRKILSKVRSIAEIGRQYSKEHTSHQGSLTTINSATDSVSQLDESNFKSKGSITLETQKHRKNSIKDFLNRESSFTGSAKGNNYFKRRLPPDSEAANIFVGHLQFLEKPISIFIRLNNSSVMGDLCEVAIPTRFLCFLLCPFGYEHQYHEIGRAFGAIMTDEVFHAVAYKARSKNDLLDGIDEFLDQVTILPPGEWDPDIRIEPPTTLPDSSKRRILAPHSGVDSSEDEFSSDDEQPTNVAVDPTLKRTGRLFGCLINDINRKLPYYKSDFLDALNLQSAATFFYMYFALLAPIVTFGGLYKESTQLRMAVVESILSCSVTGALYALFSAQPLAILSSTGPTLVFEKIIFDMCWGRLDYLAFRYWINLWSAIILFTIVAIDASTIVAYVTRFTEENFTVLVSVIFIVKAVSKIFKETSTAQIIAFDEKMLITTPYCACVYSNEPQNESLDSYLGSISPYSNKILDDGPIRQCLDLDGTFLDDPFGQCYFMYDVFLMSLILALGTFTLSYTFKALKNSIYFPTWVRKFFSLFGVIISIILMVLLDHFVNLNTRKLYVPSDFRPTWHDRSWIVDPFNGNPWWTVLLAIVPAFLLCILIFMDHNVTLVVVNRQENKLKKGCGYHLDLFILCFGIVISGVLGLPIFVAATVMSISHVKALRIENECSAPGEKPTIVGVREQRVTALLAYISIGLSIIFTDVLTYIPMAVLYGVFLYMGVTSLEGVQMIDRLLLFVTPTKYQPDYTYLRHVPINRVHLFTFIQLACFIVMYIVKEINIISLIFPLILLGTIVVRKLMDYVFTQEELQYLDDQMPEVLRREKEDDKVSDDEHENEDGTKIEQDFHIPLASGNVLTIPKSNIIDTTAQNGSSSLRNHREVVRKSLVESNAV